MAAPISITRIESTAARKIAAAFVDANHSYIRWSDRPSRKLYWEIREADRIVGVFGLGSAFAWPRLIKAWMADHGIEFNELANNIVFCLAGHTNRNAGTIALGLLRRDAAVWWRERYGNILRGIQTFILPPRSGAVYKADNWTCLGVTSGQSSKVETLTATEYVEAVDRRDIEARTFRSGEVKYLRRTKSVVEQKLIFVKAIAIRWDKGDGMIRRVESNVKTGCQVDIGPKTLIVGPNRSGKSTIVNAIELATTGRASDIAGRVTLALDAELATLMPPGAESVFARAFYGPVDGVGAASGQVAWSLEKGHKSTRGANPAPAPEFVFPLREVRENLVASAEKARKWLLGLVAAEIAWPVVLARIAPALHERVTTLSGGSVAGLPTALETAKRGVRDETRRAAVLREVVIVPVIHAPAPQPPDLGALNAGVAKAEAEVATAQAVLDALPKIDTATTEMGQRIVMILTGQIASKAPRCGVCGGDGPPGRFALRLRDVETIIAGGKKAIEARTAAAQKVNEALARRSLAWSTRSAAQTTATAVADAVTSTQAEASQAREGEAVEADRSAARWQELADAVGRVMSSLVNEARQAFEGKVQRYMPAGFCFGLDLVDGDKEVCRFGLRVAGVGTPEGTPLHLRSALSGAEWAIVTAALAAATTPDGAHAIIVPEERAFDPATLLSTLLAFAACPSQVIITSPIMPSAVPAGWTVIRCGGEIAASAALPAGTEGAGSSPPPAPPVKRGRGRPRKTPLPEPIATPPASATDVTGLPWA